MVHETGTLIHHLISGTIIQYINYKQTFFIILISEINLIKTINNTKTFLLNITVMSSENIKNNSLKINLFGFYNYIYYNL